MSIRKVFKSRLLNISTISQAEQSEDNDNANNRNLQIFSDSFWEFPKEKIAEENKTTKEGKQNIRVSQMINNRSKGAVGNNNATNKKKKKRTYKRKKVNKNYVQKKIDIVKVNEADEIQPNSNIEIQVTESSPMHSVKKLETMAKDLVSDEITKVESFTELNGGVSSSSVISSSFSSPQPVAIREGESNDPVQNVLDKIISLAYKEVKKIEEELNAAREEALKNVEIKYGKLKWEKKKMIAAKIEKILEGLRNQIE